MKQLLLSTVFLGALFVCVCQSQTCPQASNGYAQCGCFHGWCWSYLNPDSGQGDPWCYTEASSISSPLIAQRTKRQSSASYAQCQFDRDCDKSFNCADQVVHYGSDCTIPSKTTCGSVSQPFVVQG